MYLTILVFSRTCYQLLSKCCSKFKYANWQVRFKCLDVYLAGPFYQVCIRFYVCQFATCIPQCISAWPLTADAVVSFTLACVVFTDGRFFFKITFLLGRATSLTVIVTLWAGLSQLVQGEGPAKVQIKKPQITSKLVDHFPVHWCRSEEPLSENLPQTRNVGLPYIVPTTGRSSPASSCLSSSTKQICHTADIANGLKTSIQESIWCIKETHLNLDELPRSVIACLSQGNFILDKPNRKQNLPVQLNVSIDKAMAIFLQPN